MKPLTKDDFIESGDLTKSDHWKIDKQLVDQILKNQEMVKRLMESGYVLSKFGKDKTYSQTEVMYVFQGIIEGDNETTN